METPVVSIYHCKGCLIWSDADNFSWPPYTKDVTCLNCGGTSIECLVGQIVGNVNGD